MKYFGIGSFAIGIFPVARKAFIGAKNKNIDANTLMFIAAVGAMALQDYPEAAGLTFLFSLGEWLESQATGKARKALESIVSLKPETANKQITDAEGNVTIITVPAEAIQIDDLVSVKSGDKVPCDGVVVKGETAIDESSLTGESRPVRKVVDAPVFSGTINIGHSPITVKATATTENSTVAKLIELVEIAQANRSPTEKMVDEFAKRYTPIVVLASFLMCTIPWAVSNEVGHEWLERGVVLIVIACPCALIISTPVTYVAGLAATAQKGIIIKGGIHLEALSSVKTIACDKTGTLTHGEFALLELDLTDEWQKTAEAPKKGLAEAAKGIFGGSSAKPLHEKLKDRKEILRLLAVMEAESSHPMAISLVAAAKNEGIELGPNDTTTSHKILKGEGVEGEIDGMTIYVGNQRLIERLGMIDSVGSSAMEKAANWSTAGGTVGFVALKNIGVVCAFVVADKIREESKGAVSDLHRMGIDVYMLTGDGKGAADAVSKQVGIKPEFVKSQLLPVDKLNFIRRFKLQLGAPAAAAGGDAGDVEMGVVGGEETPLQEGEEDDDTSVISSEIEKKLGLFAKRNKVMMCGDGVNDAPALACADVGVAMGAGAAIAMETADIALVDSNIANVVFCVSMGRKVVQVIKQNLIFSLVTKAAVIAIVMTGYGSLWLAIGSDVGAMLCVTVNGMRLLPKKATVDFDLLEEKEKEKSGDEAV